VVQLVSSSSSSGGGGGGGSGVWTKRAVRKGAAVVVAGARANARCPNLKLFCLESRVEWQPLIGK